MSQSVKGSIAEAWMNVVIGFGVNYTANMLILPLFGFASLNWRTNTIIGVIYTGISLVRSFVLRRFFNRINWGNRR